MTRVGFAGLGEMGEGMAVRLVRARLAVTVREPRVGPLQWLMKHGAATAASDAGLGRQADIVCVRVPDADQVNGVLFGHDGDPGVLAGLRAGGIVAVHSTVSPAFMRRLGAEAARRDIGVLDAPMSGGPWDAAEGSLIFMAGGDEVTAGRARPVLDPMAAQVHHVGPLGSGIAAKIINNALTIANLAAIRETLRLACALGLPEPAVLGIVAGASGGSWASAHWDQILQLDSAATGGRAGAGQRDCQGPAPGRRPGQRHRHVAARAVFSSGSRSCPASRRTASPVTGDRPPPASGERAASPRQTGRPREDSPIGKDQDGDGRGAGG